MPVLESVLYRYRDLRRHGGEDSQMFFGESIGRLRIQAQYTDHAAETFERDHHDVFDALTVRREIVPREHGTRVHDIDRELVVDANRHPSYAFVLRNIPVANGIAGGRLVLRSDGIFQIEHHGVGTAVEGLVEPVGPIAWHEQVGHR